MKSTAIFPPYFFVGKKLEKKLKKFLTKSRICVIISKHQGETEAKNLIKNFFQKKLKKFLTNANSCDMITER